MRDSFPRTLEEVYEFVEASETGRTEDYAIEYENTLVGGISICKMNDDLKSYEIGCMWIRESYRRNGIAKTATCKLAKRIFNDFGVSWAVIRVLNSNQYVKKIVMDMGFVYNPNRNVIYPTKTGPKLLCFYQTTQDRLLGEAI